MERMRILKIIIVTLLILVGVGFLMMLLQQDIVAPDSEVFAPVVESLQTTGRVEIIDRDGDELSDDEEIRRGTDSNNPDTDGDGLTDWDEVAHYRTNPLNPDTDGDGFTDGQEVKAGYSPLSTEPVELN